MRKNKGLSLVEILVTIVIIGLLITVTAFKITTTKYANAESCTNRIEQKLSQLRLSVMSSKSQQYLIIYQASDKNYYMAICTDKDAICTADDGEKIGNSRIRIKGSTGTEDILISYSDHKRIVISFNKSTGSFISIGGNLFNVVEVTSEDVVFRIYMVKETGKHYSKRIY